jgi:hypothetical protein
VDVEGVEDGVNGAEEEAAEVDIYTHTHKGEIVRNLNRTDIYAPIIVLES